MRLAIADPPYPPNLLARGHGIQTRASRYYGTQRDGRWYGSEDKQRRRNMPPADVHPDAEEWDKPERHRRLMVELLDAFDGWAIATTPDAVAAVYAPLPRGSRVLTWIKTNALPTSHRIGSRCEAVIAFVPETRRGVGPLGQIPDFLLAGSPSLGSPERNRPPGPAGQRGGLA